MTTVCIYARVSTAGQDPFNQVERLKAVCVARGYTVFNTYVDVASGAMARRPKLDAMLKMAQLKMFDRVMCTKLDRMARSTINLLEVMQKLDNYHVAVEFLDQPIDTVTPAGRMVLTVLGAMAEFERELISDRTKDGLRHAASQGRYGGRPKRELTPYQREKAIRILAENPDISISALCGQFDGISRSTLTALLRKEGII